MGTWASIVSADVSIQMAKLWAVVYKYRLLWLHCGSCLFYTVGGSHRGKQPDQWEEELYRLAEAAAMNGKALFKELRAWLDSVAGILWALPTNDRVG
jgi:hypothetical protein